MATVTLVATYDVHEDDRRSKLAAMLQTFGDRIQKSVFVLMIDESELGSLLERATAIIDVEHDSLWLVRQCATCWDNAVTIGQVGPPKRTLYWAVL